MELMLLTCEATLAAAVDADKESFVRQIFHSTEPGSLSRSVSCPGAP